MYSSSEALSLGEISGSRKELFERLVFQYERRLYSVVIGLVGDPDQAADLVQETFVRAYKAFGRFRGDSNPYTWLYRIAVNACRDHLVKRSKTKLHESSIDDLDSNGRPMSEISDKTRSPIMLLERNELQLQVQKAIEALPLGYKECIILREIEEMSYEEIALTMDITIEAVRSRIARARAWMRQRLEPYLRS